MITLIRDSAIRIPISQCRELPWFKQAIKKLTRNVRPYGNLEAETKLYYDVDEVNREVLIPRFYPLPDDIKIVDDIKDGENINIQAVSSPKNDRQIDAIRQMTETNNGILCLGPGEGKTVITILSMCKLKKKTIIFVHKDSLGTQWIERILQHSNIRHDQIARLETATYKEDLKYPIVISTVQTFCSLLKRDNAREYIKEMNFGFAVWDECHTSMGAEQFSKSSLYTPCKRVWGLSATPERLDGDHDVMNYHVGSVYKPNFGAPDTMIPKIVFIKFDHGAYTGHEKYINHITKYDIDNNIKPFFDKTRYLGFLEKSKKFQEVTTKIVNQIFRSNRTLLFLSDRINILDFASQGCDDKDQVGFFIPRSGKEKDAHLKRRFVFSTYGSARDGTDKPELDCLILSTPVSNLDQAIGRAIRPKAGKQQPVVLQFIDTGCPHMLKRISSYEEFYSKKNWIIEHKVLPV